MINQPIDNDDGMPLEVDFSKGVRGLHHIPFGEKVFLPTSIERTVWLCISARAQEKRLHPNARSSER